MTNKHAREAHVRHPFHAEFLRMAGRISLICRRNVAIVLMAAGVILVAPSRHVDPGLLAQTSTTLSVTGSQQFQVIDGFGVNANSASWDGGELQPTLDLLVDQLGATVWRVVLDNMDWEATNDNADPNVFNWTYYNSVYSSQKFEELWSTIAYLNQKGIPADRLMLNFMGPVAGWMGGHIINTDRDENEFVEMVASVAFYGRVTRGLQFIFAPVNETDLDGIEGPQIDEWRYARVMRKLSDKLDGLGLSSMRLVGPDTAEIPNGLNRYMPEMLDDSVLMAKVDHFTLHNYFGDSGGADAFIKSSAYPTRNFWITEVSVFSDIMAHVSQGPAAILVWDAYDSVYNHAILGGRGSNPPNDAGDGPALLAYSTSTRQYTPRKVFYETAQLFKFVPPGSQRIGATDSSSSLTTYAFHDQSSGRLTIVGRTTSSGGFTLNGTLAGLPTISRLEFYQTTSSVNLQRGADVNVSNGAFSVQISGNSVFTLTTTTAPDTVSPTITVDEPVAGAVVSGTVKVAATASDNVGVAAVQFLLDADPLGSEDTAAPFELQWNTTTAAAGLHDLSAVARDAAGNLATAPSISVTVDQTDTAAPTVSLTAPGSGATVAGTVTVTAAASDNVGVSGVQFLLDGAPLGGEDTTAPYSVAWDTAGTSDGSHALSARAQDAAGNQTTSTPVAVMVNNSDTTPPAVTVFTPANGAVGVDAGTSVTATFTEPVAPATINTTTMTLRTGGNTVAATVMYSSNTATLLPSASLLPNTSYTATVSGGASGVKDLAGNALVNSVTWSFTTAAATANCPCSIWIATATPERIETSDTSAVEVGVKFHADVNGSITALRHYKGSTNTGTHVGHLWSGTGTLLATATFTGETTSGWQQVNLSSPITIAANTTYVASYYSPTGRYAVSDPYFTTAVDRPPLHALANGTAGGNGVYRYGSGGGFPTQSYDSSNYWVDVVFQPTVTDSTAPTITSSSPQNGATGVSTSANVTATFSEAMNGTTIGVTTFELRNPANSVVAATVTYNSAARTATLAPSVALANGTTYTATVRGGATDPRVKDVAGNALAANFTWSFTTVADTTPPTVTTVTPSNGATGVSSGTTATATFNEAVDAATISTSTVELRDTANALVPGGVTYNSTTRTATFAPSAALTNGTTYTATVRGGSTDPRVKDVAGNALAANFTWSFTTVTETIPPTVTMVTPSNGATGVSLATTATATFNEAMDAATISTSTIELRNPANALVPAGVTYNSATRTATLAPSAALANGTTYTATVRGGATDPRVKDLAGNALAANFGWSFTTAAAPTGCPCSLWNSTATPARIETGDTGSVELGVRFRADVNGSITGLRFYKGSTTTGTHTGKLWSNTETLLGSLTFTNETASGWQQASFATPVAITANTTYVASYHTNVGNYAETEQYFTVAVDRAPLHAPANGAGGANGVYRYGASAFPNQTYAATNYWIDVVFVPTESMSAAAGAANHPMGVISDVPASSTALERENR